MTTTSRPLRIVETVLRDAHQSLLATRMRTADMLPVAEALDEVGYAALEVWGGATFDTALRYLHEDPWERLDLLRQRIHKTPLQMLLRGQNAVGYRHYADDLVERFVEKSREHGIEIFRIFDAVNDPRNLETAIRAVKACGGHAQGTICYTVSPVFDADKAVELARALVHLGSDSICLKDMAGLLGPDDAFAIIERLKREIPLPIALHSHCTSGLADFAYLRAIEAGVDSVDCAISSMAGGTSQPPTETIVAMLAGTPRATGLDLERLRTIAEYFAMIRPRYAVFENQLAGVDASVLLHQMPGGMYSNMVSQLREQNALDCLSEVLEEMPRVRRDFGYPPLVTPTSQIVGSQAVLNVILHERYKAVTREARAYLLGRYGRPPAPIDPDLRRQVAGDEEPIDVRPGDLLRPELADAARDAAPWARGEEDVLSYALFPAVAREFFEWRASGGPEREAVAVIAAALAATAAPPAPSTAMLSPRLSPWRAAGRRRGMG
jgi:oxaloacetate decarboxylase (Na+ extruding) subunit alpha